MLQLGISLEEVTKLHKAIVLTVMVYYNERIQIKISQGENHLGQGAGESHIQSLQLHSPSGVVQTVLTPPRKNAW